MISLERDGFHKFQLLSDQDLSSLKQRIRRQWIDNITKNYPESEKVLKFNQIEIEDYHLYSHLIDHHNIWPKSSRMLSTEDTNWFCQCESFNKLHSIIPSFSVSDEDSIDRPNFYWRLVRPNEANDIGPIHRDEWFWRLNSSFPRPIYPFERLKLWISIHNEPLLNGLLVEAGSHLRNDIIWSSELRHGINKPIFSDANQTNLELVNTSPGDAILFHDRMLHAGSINHGKKTRISLEFTLIIPI